MISGKPLRYIREDKLLPGDVFLSQGGDKESGWIAAFTRGPYSHAAIYLGNQCLFESIDDGVGFKALAIVKACSNPGHGSFVLLDVSHYERLEIRRHPILRNQCQTDEGRRHLGDRLIEYLTAENGKEYPPYVYLARTVRYLPWVIVYPVLRGIAAYQGEAIKVVPGMFCSQLVVSALRRVHADPLKRNCWGRKIPPENVAPNLLQSGLSRLEPVTDKAIFDQSCDCKDAAANQWFVDQLQETQDIMIEMMNKKRAQRLRRGLHALDTKWVQLKKFLNRLPGRR